MKSDFLPSYLGSATMMDCGGPDPEDPSGKREAARMGAIAIGMASAEYRFYTAAVPRDQRWDSAPGTPDAMDHTLSRRQWKAAVHEWRKRLRAWYLSQIAHEFLPRDAAERTDQVLDRSFTSAVDAVSARQAAQAAAQAELERRELAALPPRTPESPRPPRPPASPRGSDAADVLRAALERLGPHIGRRGQWVRTCEPTG